jgi:hypothetical protein
MLFQNFLAGAANHALQSAILVFQLAIAAAENLVDDLFLLDLMDLV